jgi:hypothetical protein
VKLLPLAMPLNSWEEGGFCLPHRQGGITYALFKFFLLDA